MSFIKTAYDKDNATSRLRIVDGPVKEYDSLYEEWINDKK